MPKKESILTIEEICDELKARGEFKGNYDDLVKHVRMFFGEMSRQLSDGVTFDTGFFSVHPVVEKRSRRKRLSRSILVNAEEQSESGYIRSLTDTGTGMVNERISPGRLFIVTGNKIKIEGEKTVCGIWFVSMVDPSLRFKVTKPLIENTGSKVSGIVPVIPAGKYTIEIITKHSGGGVLLKDPRVINGGFALRNYKILTIKDEEGEQQIT